MDEEAKSKSAQANQVLGSLILKPEEPISCIEATWILNYFSDKADKIVHSQYGC